MRSFEQSLVRNGFKVQHKRSRLLGWCHTHLMVEVAGTWSPLITCKKPESGTFMRSRTVVKQFQRFQGLLSLNCAFGGHFPLASNSTRDNSEKLLGFGALHFDLPAVEMSVYTVSWGP